MDFTLLTSSKIHEGLRYTRRGENIFRVDGSNELNDKINDTVTRLLKLTFEEQQTTGLGQVAGASDQVFARRFVGHMIVLPGLQKPTTSSSSSTSVSSSSAATTTPIATTASVASSPLAAALPDTPVSSIELVKQTLNDWYNLSNVSSIGEASNLSGMVGRKGKTNNPVLLLVTETSVMGAIMQRAMKVCAENGVVGFHEAPYYRGMYLNIYNGLNNDAMNMKHHVDKAADLGNKILGVSLGTGVDLCMKKSLVSEEKRYPLCHGSLYAMVGRARTDYTHAIKPLKKCTASRIKRAAHKGGGKKRKTRNNGAETRVSVTLRTAHLSVRSMPSCPGERLRRSRDFGMPRCFVPDMGQVRRVMDVGHAMVSNKQVKLVDHVFNQMVKEAVMEDCRQPSFQWAAGTTGDIPTLLLVQQALDIVRFGADQDVWSLQWVPVPTNSATTGRGGAGVPGLYFLTNDDVKGVVLRVENLTVG